MHVNSPPPYGNMAALVTAKEPGQGKSRYRGSITEVKPGVEGR